MTAWNYLLVWLSCLFVGEIAYGNTVSPPWITLLGCFKYNSNNETSNIQKNEPTQCFEKCQGFQSVGLKNVLCICNPSYNNISVNRLCDLKCPGKSEVYCGSEEAGRDMMSVYTRDTSLPAGINWSTGYGHGYVVISESNTYHTSGNDTSMRYGYLCYDDFASRCWFDKGTWTWEGAVNECNNKGARIIIASDIGKCETAGQKYPSGGTYWIGIYRDNPDLFTTTTISTTTKITTIQTKTTITTTLALTTEKSMEMINLTVASTELKNETTNRRTVNHKTATVLVSVIIPIVLTVMTVIGVIVYKKKKMRVKHDDNRDENGLCINLENGDYGVRPGPSHLEDEDGIKNEHQVEQSGSHTERKSRKEKHMRKGDEEKRRKGKNHKDKTNKGLGNAFSDEGICPKRDIATASGVRVNVQVRDNFDLPPGERIDTRKAIGEFDLPSGEHNDTGEHKKKHKRKKRKNTNRGDGFETNYLNLENDVAAQ